MSRSILAFFSLTLLLTWGFWLAATVAPGGFGSTAYPRAGVPALLFYLGVFSPAFVAIALTRRERGWDGVRALLRRLFAADVRLRWYLFAIGYMAAIKLAAAVVYRAITGTWPHFGDAPWILLLGATLLSTVVGGQSGEEIGWRGYALPRLASRMGLGAASVLLGVIWASWHLPLFYIEGIPTTGASFPLYLIQVTALSVAVAWLYWHTGGSLLLTMLMHAAINNTTEIVPSIVDRPPPSPFGLSVSPIGWITAALLWIPATYFLIRMRKFGRATDGASDSSVPKRPDAVTEP
jgi:uncharacterized protein